MTGGRVRQGFRASDRLSKADEFSQTFKKGRWIRQAGFALVHYAADGGDERRLGISIGRGAGTAVQRNRLKRIVREYFRCHRTAFPEGWTIIRFQSGAGRLSSADLRAALKNALKK